MAELEAGIRHENTGINRVIPARRGKGRQASISDAWRPSFVQAPYQSERLFGKPGAMFGDRQDAVRGVAALRVGF